MLERKPDHVFVPGATQYLCHHNLNEKGEVTCASDSYEHPPAAYVALRQRYTVSCEEIKHGPGYWSYTQVTIFDNGQKIGEYKRNYHSYGEATFVPFEKDGKHYALYSKEYTATRVMSLPDCKDLGGEENNGWGFCPVEYYVPPEAKGRFAFVGGCVWGDDSSWKIQFLDLREIENGVIKRDDRFGYLEYPRGEDINLADLLKVYTSGASREEEGTFSVQITAIRDYQVFDPKRDDPAKEIERLRLALGESYDKTRKLVAKLEQGPNGELWQKLKKWSGKTAARFQNFPVVGTVLSAASAKRKKTSNSQPTK